MPRNELSITELARQQQSKQLREVQAVDFDNRIGTSKRTEIMVSDGLSCHPSQAQEFNEIAHKAGFSAVQFDKNGDCHIPAFGRERKRYMRFRGVYDKRSYY